MLRIRDTSWHYWLYKSWHQNIRMGRVPEQTNLCPYFWTILLSSIVHLAMLPLMVILVVGGIPIFAIAQILSFCFIYTMTTMKPNWEWIKDRWDVFDSNAWEDTRNLPKVGKTRIRPWLFLSIPSIWWTIHLLTSPDAEYLYTGMGDLLRALGIITLLIGGLALILYLGCMVLDALNDIHDSAKLNREKKRRQRDRDDLTSGASLVGHWFKAKKNKFCPIIEVVKE